MAVGLHVKVSGEGFDDLKKYLLCGIEKAAVALAYRNRSLRPRHLSATTRAWASSLAGTAPMNAPGRNVTAIDDTYPSGRCISLNEFGVIH